MNRKLFLTMSAGALASCSRHPSASPPFTFLDSRDEPFRSAFNRAQDAVRVVMLVAPT